jgi:hypothetical protein
MGAEQSGLVAVCVVRQGRLDSGARTDVDATEAVRLFDMPQASTDAARRAEGSFDPHAGAVFLARMTLND